MEPLLYCTRSIMLFVHIKSIAPHCYFFLMGLCVQKNTREQAENLCCVEKKEICSLKHTLLHKRFSCHSPHSQGSLTLTGRELCID